jgi:uncharacterized protein (DUF433 family)
VEESGFAFSAWKSIQFVCEQSYQHQPGNPRQDALLDGVATTQRKGNLMNASKVISVDPEILGGTPCFMGTRVPVDSLFDYLQGGETLEFFLDQFPSVSRAQAELLLEEAKEWANSSAGATA